MKDELTDKEVISSMLDCIENIMTGVGDELMDSVKTGRDVSKGNVITGRDCNSTLVAAIKDGRGSSLSVVVVGGMLVICTGVMVGLIVGGRTKNNSDVGITRLCGTSNLGGLEKVESKWVEDGIPTNTLLTCK